MKKILFVDDEPNVLAGLQRQLRKQFTVETAVGPVAGLAALERWRDFAVVVADMRMPEMSGVEFLVKVRQTAPDLVRLMLTGNADQATATEAVNQGNVFRFLNKPCPPEQLAAALEDALRQHQLVTAERDLLENTLSGSLKVLTEILAMVEPKSFGQAETVRDHIRLLAHAMQINQTWELEVAALLAQIGCVTLPPELALKVRLGHVLAPKEQEMFQRIPAIGGSLLAHIPRLDEVARIILHQNKHFDGSGFPEGDLSGDRIPLGSRMLKVVNDLFQLETKGVSRSAALEKLRTRTGWYDPRILDAIGEAFKLTSHDLASGDPSQRRAVTFANLRIGDILVSDLETKDGVLIVATGNRITGPLLERLRNFSTLSGIKEPIHVEG